MQELPAVAKNIHTFCKKCNADRYHVVIAHKTATSAKVKCEVCGAHKTYTVPKPPKPARERGPVSSVGLIPEKKPRASRKPMTEEARRSHHLAEYEGLLQQNVETSVQTYSVNSKFKNNQKLQHPKFGLGLIRSVHQDKIEVLFSDEVRNLVHNRG